MIRYSVMTTTAKMILLTVVIAIPALLLGRVIWPDAPGLHVEPTVPQLVLFMILAAIEAVMFGLGISLLVFGWPLTKRTRNPREAGWVLLAVVWLLANWWPHVNLHRSLGDNIPALIKIDYGFHVTAIIAALIIARTVWRGFREHIH